jgi:alpha-N-arabinofuranosidase
MMAKIKIDRDRTIGTVDQRIFGGFIEHLGRCIYGGIFEPGSSLSDERGFRRDVMEAVGPLSVPVLRWPGGNFVSGYHWTDGVGPADQRPRRLELAWGAEESNRFGTDEFIAYCRAIGAEPYICVNMGTGTIDEAQAWVEYCNGTSDTYWANLRRQNGHEEPYRVKYWGLGNEMYGHWQLGALSAVDYAKKARNFAKVMRLTDPSIQLISCGENGWSEWDREVLEELASIIDFHSIHIYTGSDDFLSNVLAPHQAERALKSCQAMIDRVRFLQGINHPISVAYDEWNVWFRERGAGSALEERYTLADALAVATYLNIFIRNCRTVRMANLAQLVNVIAPIFTSPDGLFLQSIYHPLRLYAEHTLPIALDVYVDSENLSFPAERETSPWPHRVADLGPFRALDVSATRNEDSSALTIGVINRDAGGDIPVTIELSDFPQLETCTAFSVNATDINAVNSFERPDAVSVASTAVPANTGRWFDYTFPAHSATVLALSR